MLGAADYQRRAGGRYGGEVSHELDGILPGTQQREMRDKLLCRRDVQTQRVHASSDDVSLLSEKPCCLLAEARGVHGALRVLIEEPVGIANSRIPTGVHRDERSARQAAMTPLPRHNVVYRDDRIRILGSSSFNRHDRKRRKESIRRQSIRRWAISDEMDW